jgi:hypothetical protein
MVNMSCTRQSLTERWAWVRRHRPPSAMTGNHGDRAELVAAFIASQFCAERVRQQRGNHHRSNHNHHRQPSASLASAAVTGNASHHQLRRCSRYSVWMAESEVGVANTAARGNHSQHRHVVSSDHWQGWLKGAVGVQQTQPSRQWEYWQGLMERWTGAQQTPVFRVFVAVQVFAMDQGKAGQGWAHSSMAEQKKDDDPWNTSSSRIAHAT